MPTSNCARLTIGHKGENNAYTIQLKIPEEYQDGDIYLDFSLPNGFIASTPPIAAPYAYTMSYDLLTKNGFGSADVVYKKGEVKKVIQQMELRILSAINADEILEIKYKDVVQDLQERVTRLEDSGLPADATSIDGVPVDLEGMADGQAIGLVDGKLKPVDKGGGTAATINAVLVEGDLSSHDLGLADEVHRHDYSDIDNAPSLFTADNIKAGNNVTLERDGDDVIINSSGGGSGSNEIWKPSVTVDGEISWEKSSSSVAPVPQNIKGEKGETGERGSQGDKGADGINGVDGLDGKSAYEIAVESGFVGTETEWLESLKGADGADGVDGDKGDKGDTGEKGENGYTPVKGVDYFTPADIDSLGISSKADTTYVDGLVGDISTILASVVGGGGS